MLANWKEIFKFKADNINVNFPTHFCLGSISKRAFAAESKEVCMIFHSITVLLNSSFLVHERTKCLFSNGEPCMLRPTLIDMNLVKLKYYPFMIS